jgi:hypothetical protein
MDMWRRVQVPNKYKHVLVIITLGMICMMLLTSCSYVEQFKCSWKKSAVDTELAQQLVLPISAFPEGWRSDSNSSDAWDLKDIYLYASKIITQEYSYNDLDQRQNQYGIGASHEIALYGSEECAKLEMDPMRSFPYKVEWAPLIFWNYKSAVADDYRVAVFFPYRLSGDPIGSYVVRIIVKARYGAIISVFFLNCPTMDITPDQVKQIVLALDEQFAAHKDLWKK